MPETEWGDGFKLVEVIELRGPVERVLCLIGTWPPANKVVRLETYRNAELVDGETFGFGAGLPMAELISDLEQGFRNDARATGGEIEIFEIPPPFGKEQFEQLLAARRIA